MTAHSISRLAGTGPAPDLGIDSYGLKGGVLSPLEVLGQSVANIAPTATPTVVIPLVFAVAGAGTWFGWIGTTATLGFVIAYIAVSVAAPIYLYRHGELRPWHVIVSLAAVGFMSVAFIGATYPLPEGSGIWPILAFLVLVLIGFAWAGITCLSSSRVRDDIFNSARQVDLDESLQTHRIAPELLFRRPLPFVQGTRGAIDQ